MNMFIQGTMVSGGAAAVASMRSGEHAQTGQGTASTGGFAAMLGAIMSGQDEGSAQTTSGSGLLAMLAADMLVVDHSLEGELAWTSSELDDALAQLEALLKQYATETGEEPVDALMSLPMIADWMAQVAQLREAMGEATGSHVERGAGLLLADEANDSLSKMLALAQWLNRTAAAQLDNQQLQSLKSTFDKLIMPVLEHAAKSSPEWHQALNKLATFDPQGKQVEGQASNLRNLLDGMTAIRNESAHQATAAPTSQLTDSIQSVQHRVTVAELQLPSSWNRQPFMPSSQPVNTAGEGSMTIQLASDEAVQATALPNDLKPALPVETAKPVLPVAQAAQLVKDMGELVVKQLSFQKGEGFSEARITLMPEHLGQVTIKLTMVNGQLTAQFVAETMAGRELLDSQLYQLRASLQNQGIQVEKLEVSQHSSTSAFFQDQRERDASQQFQRPQQTKTGGYGDWDDSFDAALEETAQTSWLRSGTSFEVTA